MKDDLTLVVGDVHIDPTQMTPKRMRRATLLGKYIKDTKPHRVLFIGDFLTLESLSAWDKDKRKVMEYRRYEKDIKAGRMFLDMMFAEIPDKQRANIEWVLTLGNHEYRLDRYLEKDPTFEGAVDIVKDLDISDWTIVPYKEDYLHKGVAFTHVPHHEGGRPVGGKYACNRALDIYHHSVVFGHTHKLATASVHRHGAPHLNQALNVGCYFEHIDAYAQGSVTSYWRGLVTLNHYAQNRFTWKAVTLGYLLKKYENGN